MADYKIKVIQLLLKGNQIAESGDIVDGSKFINLQESLDGGYIELAKEKKEKEKKADNGDEPTAFDLESKLIKKLNREELVEYATKNEFEINIEQSKKELLAVVLGLVEEKLSEKK